MLRSEIRELVEAVLPLIANKYGKDMPYPFKYNVDKPRKAENGDFSVDCAFQLSRIYHRSPWDLAQDMVHLLNLEIENNQEKKALIESIEPARPGFVNFTMKPIAWMRVVRGRDLG